MIVSNPASFPTHKYVIVIVTSPVDVAHRKNNILAI
jgi:hypothetical protein